MSSSTGADTTVGQYLVDRLCQIGLRHLFAIPGDYCAEWVQDYVQPEGSGIERIGPTNEINAGYAADAYARIQGIGAVCVTLSVGSFSALNPIAGAYTERVPVVLINGAPSVAKQLQFANAGLQWHHMINGQETNLRVYREVTVAAERISDPGRAPYQIDAALTACLTERRPVYLEMAEDVYDKPCQAPEGELPADRLVSDDVYRKAALHDLAHHLGRSERPVVWAGAEIAKYGLQDAFLDLVEALDVPFVTSLSGKGVVSEAHPNFRGVFDGPASVGDVVEMVTAADYVLALGVWLTDGNLHNELLDWRTMSLTARRVVKANTHLYPQVQLADVIADLTERAGELGPYGLPPKAEPPEPSRHDPDAPLTYQGVYDTALGRLDGSELILGGTGFNYFGSLQLPVGRGGFMAQANYADIGYVGPASVGACLAMRARGDDRRAIVFAGDGGFQMTATFLSTAARLGLDPVVILLDNGVYGIEQWLADPTVYGDDAPFYPLCDLHRWDYAGLCRSMGGQGWHAETFGELAEALDQAAAYRDGPSLVQATVPSKSLPENAEYRVRRQGALQGSESAFIAAANPAS